MPYIERPGYIGFGLTGRYSPGHARGGVMVEKCDVHTDFSLLGQFVLVGQVIGNRHFL